MISVALLIPTLLGIAGRRLVRNGVFDGSQAFSSGWHGIPPKELYTISSSFVVFLYHFGLRLGVLGFGVFSGKDLGFGVSNENMHDGRRAPRLPASTGGESR